jgi:predicted nucleic acid-binding Zn ribbon protein
MAYRDDQFEEDELCEEGDAGLDEREDPDESDMDESDAELPAIPCPYCRKEILEDAEICPHCRNFISYEDAPRHYPGWLVAGVVVCILIVLIWVVRNA